MKKLAPLLLFALAGCHRLTGLEGRAGEARHGNGFHILSQVSLWLALFAIIAGVSFVVRGLVARRGESDRILWGYSDELRRRAIDEVVVRGRKIQMSPGTSGSARPRPFEPGSARPRSTGA